MSRAGAFLTKPGDFSWETMSPAEKAATLSKVAVGYRPASGVHHCGNCVMFHAGTQACDLVKGRIEASDVCDRWEAGPVDKSFNPAEMRDPSGKWVKFYHGTTKRFKPGDLILPASQVPEASRERSHGESSADHVYMTRDPGLAAQYAGMRDDPDPESPHDDRYSVYQVEPTGEFEDDPQHTNNGDGYSREPNYRSTSPVRVVRRMPYSHAQIRDAGTPESWESDDPRIGQEISHPFYRISAEKARRIVGLNGQETWEDGDNGPPYPASGSGASLPPGGVPGSTAGGEPPRWDGGQQEPRAEATHDDADDAEWPTEGRVAASSRGGAGFPATYMDGYWPQGGHGTQQAGTSSPGGERGVPPSTVRGKKKVQLSEVVKVGPEGYIHGYICVRPPCGPRYTEARFDSSKGAVEHEGARVGKMRKNDDGTYSMVHHRGDGTKSKLDAKYATRADAARSVALYHNLDVLHDRAADGGHFAVAEKALRARDALAAGDHDAAQAFLVSAELEANKAGNRALASHLLETRRALVTAPKPVNAPAEASAEDWGKHFAGEAPAPVPVPEVPAGMHDPDAPDGITPVPTPSFDDAGKPVTGITTNPSLLERAGARLAREYRQNGEVTDRTSGFGMKLLSRWDLSTYPERLSAEDSGAQWYKQVRSVVRGAGPHDRPLSRGMTMDRVPRQGESMRVPLSNWTEDLDTASNYGNITLHLPQDEPAMDVHALGGDEPMSNFIAGGGSFNVERVDGGDVYLTRKPVTAKAPVAAAVAIAAPASSPVHELEPPAGPEIPRPAAMKSVVPVSDDPPDELLDAMDKLDRLKDEARQLNRAGRREEGYAKEQEAGNIEYGIDWSRENPTDDGNLIPDSVPGIAKKAGLSNTGIYKASLLHENRQYRKDLAEENNLTLEEADRRMARELKSIAENGHVASRVTNAGLEHILDDNAFKTQFETNRSKALKANDIRAEHESAWFGYPEDLEPSLRPFYGYITDGGPDRPVGVGTKDWFGFNTDQLSSCGTTQVIFKDGIKSRTSMNVGDSLNAKEGSMPSPMLDPDARSYAAYDEGKPDPHGGFGRTYKHGLANATGLRGMNRDYTGGDFRQHTFVEAQIHSPDGANRPATPADIDHVLFDSPPPASLRAKLDAKGIPWKVWNAHAIAKSGTPEEKARALEVTNQDIEHADDQLKFMNKNLAEAEARDRRDEYTINSWKKDIASAGRLREKLLKSQAALQKASA